MPKSYELSVQSFVNYKGNYINISLMSKAEKNEISQNINIKALNRLNERYIFERSTAKS